MLSTKKNAYISAYLVLVVIFGSYVDCSIIEVSLNSSSSSSTLDCLQTPNNSQCINYTIPDAQVIINISRLCGMMYMPGCSVFILCNNHQTSGPFCNPFSIYKQMCVDMPMSGCNNYSSLCRPGSVVEECNMNTLNLPYNVIYNDFNLLCSAYPTTDCNSCNQNFSCPFLLAYVDLCKVHPDSQYCDSWREMCVTVSNWTVICLTTTPTPTPTVNNCVLDPTPVSCEGTIIPDSNLTSYINQYCLSSYSLGCSILSYCENNQASGLYCDRFRIYKLICTDETARSQYPHGIAVQESCLTYETMCQAHSQVKECNRTILHITNSMIINDILQICSSMYMDGCDKCHASSCNGSLQIYSDLCLSMPDMAQCSDWKRLCYLVGDWYICSGNPIHPIPPMMMYFHLGILDYILFSSWVPHDTLTYVLSLLAVFCMALFHEVIRVFKIYVEAKFNLLQESSLSHSSSSSLSPLDYHPSSLESLARPPPCHQPPPPLPPLPLLMVQCQYPKFNCRHDTLKALLEWMDVTAHFLIMLITMTFNVGLFLAVVVGYGVGHFALSRFQRPIVSGKVVVQQSYSCH